MVYHKFGRSTCHYYTPVKSTDELVELEKHVQIANNIVSDLNVIIEGIMNLLEELVRQAASQLITVICNEHRWPLLNIVTAHVACCLFIYDNPLSQDVKAFWKSFDTFWDVPATRSSAGWIWQPHVKHAFHDGD